MILFKRKDGGPDSTVTGYWFCEFKKLFSVVLLKFEGKSREAFHNHAFTAYSWILKGHLTEEVIGAMSTIQPKTCYGPSLKPIWTPRDMYHKVDSKGTTWVLSFRGPWSDEWAEYDLKTGKERILSHGRKVVVDGQENIKYL